MLQPHRDYATTRSIQRLYLVILAVVAVLTRATTRRIVGALAGAISLAGGLGTFIPGVVGCALFPIFARRLPLRLFYLANGIIGSVFTLSLLALPHATSTFALAMFGKFLCPRSSQTHCGR